MYHYFTIRQLLYKIWAFIYKTTYLIYTAKFAKITKFGKMLLLTKFATFAKALFVKNEIRLSKFVRVMSEFGECCASGHCLNFRPKKECSPTVGGTHNHYLPHRQKWGHQFFFFRNWKKIPIPYGISIPYNKTISKA
jgi:hypothetical protein